jgi:hypothetical protein
LRWQSVLLSLDEVLDRVADAVEESYFFEGVGTG